jgi:hypothetical protein
MLPPSLGCKTDGFVRFLHKGFLLIGLRGVSLRRQKIFRDFLYICGAWGSVVVKALRY